MFTAITLITLAVGIGANSAIFSVLSGVLLKPLPYPNPDQLLAVWETAPGLDIKEINASPSTYFTFREENIDAGNRRSLPDQDASRLAREVGDLGQGTQSLAQHAVSRDPRKGG